MEEAGGELAGLEGEVEGPLVGGVLHGCQA
jgi:hypothetical protein